MKDRIQGNGTPGMDGLQSLDPALMENTISSGVTLAVFSAPWCGPCREQRPILKALSGRFPGKVAITEINVDENRQSAFKLQIMSIPTIILFKSGKEVKRFVGVQSTETLSEAVISGVKLGITSILFYPQPCIRSALGKTVS
jgi:thioredoxin 1